ncbi:hypothetical protein [Hydrogenophaga sp. MI9]|uniref:hypothetical protein n=1 Tax=Hydrogenophaga sp. MI9 TaxID=3453719 RepID=UPI003EEE0C08
MSTQEEIRPPDNGTPEAEPRWQRWLQWLVAAVIAALGLVSLLQPVPQFPGNSTTGTTR